MDISVYEVSKILLDVMDKVAEISGASGEGGQLEPGGMKSNADMFDTTAASTSTTSSSSAASSPAPGHGGGARERDHSEYLVLREDYSHRPRKGSHFYCLRTLQTLCYTPIKCWME